MFDYLGRVKRIEEIDSTDVVQQATENRYTTFSRLKEVEDHTGMIWTNTYDNYNLTNSSDPESGDKRFEYKATGVVDKIYSVLPIGDELLIENNIRRFGKSSGKKRYPNRNINI